MAPHPSGKVALAHVLVTLLFIAVVAFGAYRVVSTAAALAGARDGPIDVTEYLPPEVVSVPSGVRAAHWVKVSVHIGHPTRAQAALASALGLAPVVLLAAGLWLLRGVTGSVRRGDPFVPGNVRRLRGIGFVLVAGSIASELIQYSLRLALYNRLPPMPSADLGSFGFTTPGAALVAGLGVFVLAEVFAHGVRLREDVEGTV